MWQICFTSTFLTSDAQYRIKPSLYYIVRIIRLNLLCSYFRSVLRWVRLCISSARQVILSSPWNKAYIFLNNLLLFFVDFFWPPNFLVSAIPWHRFRKVKFSVLNCSIPPLNMFDLITQRLDIVELFKQDFSISFAHFMQ